MATSKVRKTQRTVQFEVKTTKPLPVGQQVFVAGNQRMLGNWRADGLPLTRMGENVWSGHAILSVADSIEFKITRGSWDTESVTEAGVVPGNQVIKPGGDTTLRLTVAAWRDQFD